MRVSQSDPTVFALSFYKRRCLVLQYQSRLQVLTGLICVASPPCEAGDQIPLCVVYGPACHPLKAAALIVVKRHSISAGHFRQSYREEEREEKKKKFNSLSIIQMGVFSCSPLLEAFSSLNFLAHLPPTRSHTAARWKGPLCASTYMPLTVEWNIYLWNLKTCIHPWH